MQLFHSEHQGQEALYQRNGTRHLEIGDDDAGHSPKVYELSCVDVHAWDIEKPGMDLTIRALACLLESHFILTRMQEKRAAVDMPGGSCRRSWKFVADFW